MSRNQGGERNVALAEAIARWAHAGQKRMDKLDESTRDRLTKKYAHALEVLQS